MITTVDLLSAALDYPQSLRCLLRTIGERQRRPRVYAVPEPAFALAVDAIWLAYVRGK